MGEVPLLRRRRVPERPVPNRSCHQVRPAFASPVCLRDKIEFVCWCGCAQAVPQVSSPDCAETLDRRCSRDGFGVEYCAAPKWRNAATTPQHAVKRDGLDTTSTLGPASPWRREIGETVARN